MEVTATITALTASIESLEKRIKLLPTSGEARMVEQNIMKINVLQTKIGNATKKLDQIMAEILS